MDVTRVISNVIRFSRRLYKGFDEGFGFTRFCGRFRGVGCEGFSRG